MWRPIARSTVVVVALSAAHSPLLAQGICDQLSAQLARLDREAAPNSFGEAAGRQRQELARAEGMAQRCTDLTSGACASIAQTVTQMRANLARLDAAAQRERGAASGAAERARIQRAMQTNSCGEQPRTEVRTAQRDSPARAMSREPSGLFGFFPFGRGPVLEREEERAFYQQRPFGEVPRSLPERHRSPLRVAEDTFTSRSPGFGPGPYRTLCVRACDGYFWPVSWSTTRAGFRRDEEICRAACPNMDVALYVHRNPGGDSMDAVALDGTPYAEHENANLFRRSFNPNCTCRPVVAPEPEATQASYGQDDQLRRGFTPVPALRSITFERPPFIPSSQPIGVSARNQATSDTRVGREGLRGVHPDRVAP